MPESNVHNEDNGAATTGGAPPDPQPSSSPGADSSVKTSQNEPNRSISAALHKEIASHDFTNQSCCNASTSYIHVYHHSTGCQHSQATESTSSQNTVSTGETQSKSSSFSSGGPIALFKQLIENFKPGSHAGQQKKQKSEDRKANEAKNDSATAEETADDFNWVDDLVPPPPPIKRLWHGLDGVTVMSLAVVGPMLLTVLAMASCPKRITLVMLSHPVETLIELALLLAIPIANLLLWKAICKNDVRYSLRKGVVSGAAIATSFIIAGLSFAAIPAGYQELQSSIGTDFTTGFFVIGVQGLVAGLLGLALINKVRLNKEFTSTRTRVVVYTIVGFILGLAAFAACEARSWYVRLAEQEAMSPKEDVRKKGLATLRALDTERELRMETSDSRAAGIAGLFIPVKHSEMSKLYFTVWGKPFSDENSADFSSMSDDYLQRHVVGSPVKGLELARSAFNGLVSPDSLSSKINWTFVFRNDTESPQEARAELALPPGAVIDGLTVWKKGDPLEAAFAAAGKAEGDAEISWIDVGHDSPAIITDLGRGRYLFHCYPIPHDEQLKVNLSVVVPLNLESLDSTSLTFPRFIATNFSLDGEHSLMLESTNDLMSRAKNFTKSKGLQGRVVMAGTLEPSQLEHTPLVINAKRAADMIPVATIDKIATDAEKKRWKEEQEKKKAEEEAKLRSDQQVVLMIDGSRGVQQQLEDVRTIMTRDRKAKKQAKKLPPGPRWAVRTIREVVTKAPKRLLVVLDGSNDIKAHLPAIKDALAKVPGSVPVMLSVASRDSKLLSTPTPLRSALPVLDKISFEGGQDNLKSVVQAAELAGETEGGAVLWIHGSQPGLNKDIYILSPFRAHPSFFEIALDTGCTDTLEYFKNHPEVGPFTPIQRTDKLTEDLTDFFSKWQAGRREFVVSYDITDKPAKDARVISGLEKQELLLLTARSKVESLMRNKQVSKAARMAVSYQFVSPVSCVTVIGKGSYDGSEPALQGASNGTIGPQGGDATAIMGVNTAGTVRVNNLANLEVLLNMICSLIEMVGLMFGCLIILHGLFVRVTVDNFLGMKAQFSPSMRIAIGAAIVTGGLMVPGLVNWFVASARDANLFS